MRKIKIGALTTALTLLTFSFMGLTVASALPSAMTVFAAESASHQAACAGLTEVDSGQDCSSNGGGVIKVVGDAISILRFAAGIVAVIMVLVSGFRYITSGGEASKVAVAKNALIYALVGIAIAAVAQVLVHFVINTADNSTQCPVPGLENLTKGDSKCKP